MTIPAAASAHRASHASHVRRRRNTLSSPRHSATTARTGPATKKTAAPIGQDPRCGRRRSRTSWAMPGRVSGMSVPPSPQRRPYRPVPVPLCDEPAPRPGQRARPPGIPPAGATFGTCDRERTGARPAGSTPTGEHIPLLPSVQAGRVQGRSSTADGGDPPAMSVCFTSGSPRPRDTVSEPCVIG